MRIDVGLPDFGKLADELRGDVALATTTAMRETMPIALGELRDQVVSSGLGARLANTWRGETYPGDIAKLNRKVSVSPAGYIWSNAPDIINSFSRGSIIRPASGGQYLWIPTSNVPRARSRVVLRSTAFGGPGSRNVTGSAMTPDEVQAHFDAGFVFKRGKAGTLLAMIDVIAARNGRGYRKNTARRRQVRGVESQLVVMFVLRRSVQMPRLLDIDQVARRWADRYAAAVERRLGAA